MTTTSEVVLVACLVRQQLFQHVVTVRQYAAEEFVVAADGQLRRRWIVGMVETKPHSSSNKCFNDYQDIVCQKYEDRFKLLKL